MRHRLVIAAGELGQNLRRLRGGEGENEGDQRDDFFIVRREWVEK